jgi:DnaJ-class molecular chaperone
MTTIYHEQGFDEDKYFGVAITCMRCGGSGVDPVEEDQLCWGCDGEGWVIDTDIESAEDAEIPY